MGSMNAVATIKSSPDVVIVGAGLSGIGAAVHLKKSCPSKSFILLESRTAIGGTWDLFRYPGIRSDSDMYTFGYGFKPWKNPKAIADGKDIREYIQETAAEYNIKDHIRFQHKFISADWSSRKARWTLTVERTDTGEQFNIETRFVIAGTGYYRYDQGITPEFQDKDKFKGDILHPQFWPENYDYSGKKVVVIGSGATAITLIPAMADKTEHITMLQRSPTYVMSVPQKNPLPDRLRKYFKEETAYKLTRTSNMLMGLGFFNYTRQFPGHAKNFLVDQVEKQVGPSYDAKDFTPKYNPWDQRLCTVPDGDLFEVLKAGKASVVTDHIERFTENGILLKSGKELEADIIVTATGLDVRLLGGAEITLDGQPVDISKKHYYRGAMLEDVPNFGMIFGYTNSSWTLKSDLISDYLCRVINHMDKNHYAQCTPRDNGDISASEPFLNFGATYVQRVIDSVPMQGDKKPWRLYQNYLKDYYTFKFRKLNDNVLVFSNPVSHGYGYGLEQVTMA